MNLKNSAEQIKNYFNIKDFTLKMNFLTEILNTKKDEISDLKKRFSFNSFREMEFFNRQPLSFYNDAISGKAISIIAEIKKASPSKGIIREDFNHIAIRFRALRLKSSLIIPFDGLAFFISAIIEMALPEIASL